LVARYQNDEYFDPDPAGASLAFKMFLAFVVAAALCAIVLSLSARPVLAQEQLTTAPAPSSQSPAGPTTDPAPTGTTATNPAPADTIVADPTKTDPAPTGATVTDPAPIETATTDPVADTICDSRVGRDRIRGRRTRRTPRTCRGRIGGRARRGLRARCRSGG
jgi:hypothetical protein